MKTVLCFYIIPSLCQEFLPPPPGPNLVSRETEAYRGDLTCPGLNSGLDPRLDYDSRL